MSTRRAPLRSGRPGRRAFLGALLAGLLVTIAGPALPVAADDPFLDQDLLGPADADDAYAAPTYNDVIEAPAPGELLYVVDSDGDAISDGGELDIGSNPNSSNSDSDALSDYEEYFLYGTSLTNPDTDGDGASDSYEVFGCDNAGGGASDPLDPNSRPPFLC